MGKAALPMSSSLLSMRFTAGSWNFLILNRRARLPKYVMSWDLSTSLRSWKEGRCMCRGSGGGVASHVELQGPGAPAPSQSLLSWSRDIEGLLRGRGREPGSLKVRK